MDPIAEWHVASCINRGDVSKAPSEVRSYHLVHAELGDVKVLVGKDDANCVLLLLFLDQHIVHRKRLSSSIFACDRENTELSSLNAS